MKKSAKEVRQKTKMLWKSTNSWAQDGAIREAGKSVFTGGIHPETLQQSYGLPLGTYNKNKHGRIGR